MIIIIEGPDGAGKTTLVNYLVEKGATQRPREYVDSVQGPDDDLATWVQRDLQQLNLELETATGTFEPIWVYDRHPLISEPIYGPPCRGSLKPGFESEKWFKLNWVRLLDLKPVVIFCLPPLPVVRRNILMSSPNQMPKVLDNLETIWYSYFHLATRWFTIMPPSTPIVWRLGYIYDYTQRNQKDILNEWVIRTLVSRLEEKKA